jgi:hypothetical protein
MNEKDTLQPWEMMREAKECLGMPALQRIFKIGGPALYAQMVNPDYAAKASRPVLQRIRMMLHDLHESGGALLAHAMLNYMAVPLEMHLEPNAAAVPDKNDLRDECLDDTPPLTLLHEMIREGSDLRAVESQAAEVVREIQETVVAYRQNLEGEEL